MFPYEVELEKICAEINRKRYKKIGIQLPEGLRSQAQAIAEKIELETNAVVMIQGEPCYGACDPDFGMNVNFIVHFGHSKMLSTKVPTFFAECRSKLGVIKAVEKAIELLDKNVGVITIVQYAYRIKEVKKILEEFGLKPWVGKGSSRIKYPGQVLGCDFSAALAIKDKVNTYLYLGSGNFHPLGVSFATGKKVVIADPELNEAREIENMKEEILRERWKAIELAMRAKIFGVLLGKKLGQQRERLALKIKKTLERKGRKALLIALNNIEAKYLSSFPCDAFVCTACPRIAIDDSALYDKPILTSQELEIALGLREFEAYEFDQIKQD